MELLLPKYRRAPNEKVHSLYVGVASRGRTVTRLVKAAVDRNHLEATQEYGPGIARGQGGRVAVLVLGGMETTLDEMEYLVQAKQEKKFRPQRQPHEIADMCRLLIERRNEKVRALWKLRRTNPSEAPKKRRVTLHLPVGFRYADTAVPGMKVLARL